MSKCYTKSCFDLIYPGFGTTSTKSIQTLSMSKDAACFAKRNTLLSTYMSSPVIILGMHMQAFKIGQVFLRYCCIFMKNHVNIFN